MREDLYKKILKNDLTILLLFFSLFTLGLFFLSRMTVSSMPRHSRPSLTIITDYYGMEPETIEHVITRPLERVMKESRGVKGLDSLSLKGRSRIVVSLDPAADVDIEAVLLMDRIYHVSRNFPKDVRDPVLYRYNTDDSPALIVSLTKRGQSDEELHRLVETRIRQELLSIDGVANVEIAGPGKKDYFIVQDYENMSRLDGDFDAAFENVVFGNVSVPLGILKNEADVLALDFPNAYENLFALPAYPGVVRGNIVSGYDLFSVRKIKREDVPISYVNNLQSPILYIFKKDFSSILPVDRSVRRALERWNSVFSCTYLYDQAKGFKNLLMQLLAGSAAANVCIFVLLIIFYKRFLYVWPVMTTIPICLSGTLALTAAFGMGMNIMTLSALIVGTAVCVNNTLIVVEPFQKAMKRGSGEVRKETGTACTPAFRSSEAVEATEAGSSAHTSSTHQACRVASSCKTWSRKTPQNSTADCIISGIMARVYRPILASTVTTVVAFLPLFYINGAAVSLYADFARTISLMLVLSCLVSLFFLPCAMRRLVYVNGLSDTGSTRLFRKNKKPVAKKNALNDVLPAAAKLMLKRPTFGLALFFLCQAVFTVLFLTLDFRDVSPLKEKELTVFYEFEPKFNTAYRKKAVESIGDEILCFGFPLTLVSKLENERATFFIGFRAHNMRYKKAASTIKAHISAIKRDDGFFYFESGDEAGLRQLRLLFFGDDLKRLNDFVDEAAGNISGWSGVDRVLKGYKMGKPEIEFHIDSKILYFYDLNVSDVIRFLRYIFYYPVIMKHYEDGAMMDVRGRIEVEGLTKQNLSLLRVPGNSGTLVSLADFSDIRYRQSPGAITHRNGKRYISLNIQYEGMKEEEFIEKLRSHLDSIDFYEDFYYTFDENLMERQKTGRLFLLTLVIAAFSVYAVLGIVLKSFDLPLTVMSSVFSFFIGVYFFLAIGGYNRCVPAHIGIILLIGLSVNSVIILLEEVLHLQKGKVCGRRADKIILLALRRKMRTIALMLFTTLFSVMPVFLFTSSTYFFRILTGVIFSGLIIGIPFSVLVFSILFKVFYLSGNGR